MLSKLCAGLVKRVARPCEVRHLMMRHLMMRHLTMRHLTIRQVLVFGKHQKGISVRENHSLGKKVVPSRDEHISALKGEEFDVLIIGGGAVGCGCAVDSACRGLKTALVEADDFASGASSRTTKLIDGSVSYLATALRDKDLQQLYIMGQMMSERRTMLKIAPHLNRVQPMVIPVYSALRMPFTWLALKIYDFISATANVRASHFLSKARTLNEFPLLKTKDLRGGVVYYDVQVDDVRMCMALCMTAVALGANVANHCELVEMVPQEGCCRVVGVKDTINDEVFYIQARAVINATGARTDFVRKLDEESTAPILVPTVGTHITLPRYFGSGQYGLLSMSENKKDPTIVMVPFENRLLLGLRESEADEVESGHNPSPDLEDVECLLDTAREKLEPCVVLERAHVLSAWTGIRPNVSCPTGKPEEEEEGKRTAVSTYVMEVSEGGLITLAGGRWSSYRVMAENTVDLAIEVCGLCDEHVTSSWTDDLELDGAPGWCCLLPLEFVQDYGVPMDVAQHISESYGYNGHILFTQAPGLKKRLHPNFPYIEAEVQYAIRNEYACTVVDIIARRLKVVFVDAAATLHMLPKILKLMASELGWSDEQKTKEQQKAQEFLVRQMGLGSIVRPKSAGQKKSTPESCCRGVGEVRKECRSYSQDATLRASSGHALVRPPVQKLAAMPWALTSGITHSLVEPSPESSGRPRSIPSHWTDMKRDLILNIWRNKFKC